MADASAGLAASCAVGTFAAAGGTAVASRKQTRDRAWSTGRSTGSSSRYYSVQGEFSPLQWATRSLRLCTSSTSILLVSTHAAVHGHTWGYWVLTHVTASHPGDTLGSSYVQERPAQNIAQDAGLAGQGWPFGCPTFCLGKTPPTHAAEPRDCPCRPRAPQRVRVRIRGRVNPRVGLVWADVQG